MTKDSSRKYPVFWKDLEPQKEMLYEKPFDFFAHSAYAGFSKLRELSGRNGTAS
jgi:hypothetical protein